MPLKNNPLDILAKKKPEKLLRSLLEMISEGVIIVDGTLRIIETNAKLQELYRIPHDKLIGEDLRKLLDTLEQETFQEIILGLEDGQAWQGQVTCWLTEKEPVPTKVSLKRTDMSNQRLFLLVLEDPRSYKTLEERLSREKIQTREMYITLRNVMKAIEQEKKGWEGEIANKIERYLLPALERIKREPYGEMRNSYLDLVREHLLGLTRGFSRELDGRFLRLTRSEMRICRYIQGGYSTKEISEAMHTSFETIQTHRKNIRKKLGLRGRTINLYSYLATREKQPEPPR